MPIRNPNPFVDPTAKLLSTVNPFVEELKNPDLPTLYGEALVGKAGRWLPNEFDKLFVEIGSYKGKTLVEMALDHPRDFFVGIDITFKRVVSAAKRAVKHEAHNVSSVLAHMNSESLLQLFGPGEIDLLMVFFPDPWTKKKQNKNRIISNEFCSAAKKCLNEKGKLWFKTDHLPYFQFAEETFSASGFQRVECLSIDTQKYETPFERTFKNQGLPTYESFWQAKC